jgi:hypothetical protein
MNYVLCFGAADMAGRPHQENRFCLFAPYFSISIWFLFPEGGIEIVSFCVDRNCFLICGDAVQ